MRKLPSGSSIAGGALNILTALLSVISLVGYSTM